MHIIMKKSELKGKLINASVTTTQVVFGSIHLGLKYAIDFTENCEVEITKRLTGEESKYLKNKRRKCTLKKQEEHKKLAKEAKQYIKNVWGSIADEEIIQETY